MESLRVDSSAVGRAWDGNKNMADIGPQKNMFTKIYQNNEPLPKLVHQKWPPFGVHREKFGFNMFLLPRKAKINSLWPLLSTYRGWDFSAGGSCYLPADVGPWPWKAKIGMQTWLIKTPREAMQKVTFRIVMQPIKKQGPRTLGDSANVQS